MQLLLRSSNVAKQRSAKQLTQIQTHFFSFTLYSLKLRLKKRACTQNPSYSLTVYSFVIVLTCTKTSVVTSTRTQSVLTLSRTQPVLTHTLTQSLLTRTHLYSLVLSLYPHLVVLKSVSPNLFLQSTTCIHALP